MEKNIEIYTSTTCHFCKDLKEFLDARGITYTEHEISTDEEKRKELMERSQQLGVPVTFIDGTMVVGFDKEKLVELLGIDE